MCLCLLPDTTAPMPEIKSDISHNVLPFYMRVYHLRAAMKGRFATCLFWVTFLDSVARTSQLRHYPQCLCLHHGCKFLLTCSDFMAPWGQIIEITRYIASVNINCCKPTFLLRVTIVATTLRYDLIGEKLDGLAPSSVSLRCQTQQAWGNYGDGRDKETECNYTGKQSFKLLLLEFLTSGCYCSRVASPFWSFIPFTLELKDKEKFALIRYVSPALLGTEYGLWVST